MNRPMFCFFILWRGFILPLNVLPTREAVVDTRSFSVVFPVCCSSHPVNPPLLPPSAIPIDPASERIKSGDCVFFAWLNLNCLFINRLSRITIFFSKISGMCWNFIAAACLFKVPAIAGLMFLGKILKNFSNFFNSLVSADSFIKKALSSSGYWGEKFPPHYFNFFSGFFVWYPCFYGFVF